jgi:hypothetical protein
MCTMTLVIDFALVMLRRNLHGYSSLRHWLLAHLAPAKIQMLALPPKASPAVVKSLHRHIWVFDIFFVPCRLWTRGPMISWKVDFSPIYLKHWFSILRASCVMEPFLTRDLKNRNFHCPLEIWMHHWTSDHLECPWCAAIEHKPLTLEKLVFNK